MINNSMIDNTLEKYKLIQIFRDKFNIDWDKLDEEFKDMNLLGSDIRLEARELLFLFNKIETEFHMLIPQEAIANNRFTTFNNILSIITSQKKTI